MALPYWLQDEKWQARGLLFLLLLLLFGQTGFSVLFNQLTGEFTSALAAKDAPRFWAAIRECFLILVLAVPIYAFYYYVRDRLGIGWRRWMTRKFLSGYFERRAYYELNSSTEIDNPDQRISEDINTFTQRSLYYLMVVIGSVFDLLAFSGVLWSISTDFVYFLIAYAFAGTAIVLAVFGKVLIGLNFYQLKREANFRFSLVRVRENAEAIAFYRGEKQEASAAEGRFNEAFDNYIRLIRSQLNLNLFQYGYSFLTIILPSAIIANRVLSGKLEVGSAIQAAGAFAAILRSLTLIVDNFEGFSRFVAGIDRLESFSDYLSAHEGSGKSITMAEGGRVSLENLTVRTPNRGRILVSNLTVSVEPGSGLMIAGISGSGKSSLLRAIAGLWHEGSGRIVSPDHDGMLFLPQRPYMLLGSLRSQLVYPRQDMNVKDEELLRLLSRVNLPDVAERLGGLDAELDWAKVLSVGEQQRVAIARALLAAPRYAILDEATSALDEENEEHLYRELAGSGTTLISVAHRTSIVKYHAQVLELDGQGGWRLFSSEEYAGGSGTGV